MPAQRIRIVDAFTDHAFSGNPAAVAVLETEPDDDWMQAIAAELNLSETAFVLPLEHPEAEFRLRWFTPGTEVDLCGHATLAAAHCLLDDGVAGPIRFLTRSGVLSVNRTGAVLTMDFPARPPVPIAIPGGLTVALGAEPVWTGRGGTDDLLCELRDEDTVRDLTPDIAALIGVEARGVIVTARADAGRDYDFVSRFFAPRVGVAEDPVTGSAHTVLAPYWADKLGRATLSGFQASRRGGRIGVDLRGDRVVLSGQAVSVLDGELSAAASAATAAMA
jgi:predicted PhzF superfamily epimerase YddE/YHI9